MYTNIKYLGSGKSIKTLYKIYGEETLLEEVPSSPYYKYVRNEDYEVAIRKGQLLHIFSYKGCKFFATSSGKVKMMLWETKHNFNALEYVDKLEDKENKIKNLIDIEYFIVGYTSVNNNWCVEMA